MLMPEASPCLVRLSSHCRWVLYCKLLFTPYIMSCTYSICRPYGPTGLTPGPDQFSARVRNVMALAGTWQGRKRRGWDLSDGGHINCSPHHDAQTTSSWARVSPNTSRWPVPFLRPLEHPSRLLYLQLPTFLHLTYRHPLSHPTMLFSFSQSFSARFVLSALAAIPVVIAASVTDGGLEARAGAEVCDTTSKVYSGYTNFVLKGCAHDSAKRALTGTYYHSGSDNYMEAAECHYLCSSNNYSIAGIETGRECYCKP